MTTTNQALRMAIEAMKDFDYDKRLAAIKVCESALAEDDGEAIAYIQRDDYNDYRLEPTESFSVADLPHNVKINLFPRPTKRLSEEEIAEFLFGLPDLRPRTIANAIQDRLLGSDK